MSTEIRAVQFSALNQVETVTQSLDTELGPGEVLLKSHYTCISAGTELAKLTGLQEFAFPAILGNRAVTEVLAVGNEVERFQVGDLVLSYTAHAEMAKINRGMIPGKLSAALDAPETAMLGMAMVAMGGICTADPAEGDHVLVTGGGLVGQFAAQLTQAHGATAILSDPVAGRREKATACGVKHVTDPADLAGLVDDLTDGKGVEQILECSGLPAVLLDAVPSARRSATVVLVGSPRGECHVNVTDLLSVIHLWIPHGDLTLKGAHEWKYPVHPDGSSSHSHESNLETLVRFVQEGSLQLKPLLTGVFDPGDPAAAYDSLRENAEHYLGAVFSWIDQ